MSCSASSVSSSSRIGAPPRRRCDATARVTVRFASAAEYVRVQFAATPLAALLTDLDQPERDRLVSDVSAAVSEALSTYVDDDTLAFPQEVHVVLVSAE